MNCVQSPKEYDSRYKWEKNELCSGLSGHGSLANVHKRTRRQAGGRRNKEV